MSLFAIAPAIPSAFSEMVSHETGLENLLELYKPSDIIKDPVSKTLVKKCCQVAYLRSEFIVVLPPVLPARDSC